MGLHAFNALIDAGFFSHFVQESFLSKELQLLTLLHGNI